MITTSTPALPHNEYRTPTGVLIRLINDDVLVKIDKPREKTSGGIVIPDTAGDRGDAGILATGTILAFGFASFGGRKVGGAAVPFTKIPLPELYVGAKTAFIRYYAEQDSNKQIQYRIEGGVIRMKPLDLLFLFDPEDLDRVLR
jgi:co-chaperonin GroES (HSP10)